MNELAFTLAILVASNGSQNYETREEAAASLQKIMPFAEAHLIYFYKNATDLEIKHRCNGLLYSIDKSYLVVSAWNKPFPWIDGLPNDYPFRNEVIKDYLDRVKDRATANGTYAFTGANAGWPQYSEATKLWASDMLKEGVELSTIISLLNGMAEKQSEWYKKNSQTGVIPPY